MAKAVIRNNSGVPELVSATEYIRRRIDGGFDVYPVIKEVDDTLLCSRQLSGRQYADALTRVANLLGVPNEFREDLRSLRNVLEEMVGVIHRKRVVDEKNIYEGGIVTYHGWDCEIEKISRGYRVTLRFYLDGSAVQCNPLSVD